MGREGGWAIPQVLFNWSLIILTYVHVYKLILKILPFNFLQESYWKKSTQCLLHIVETRDPWLDLSDFGAPFKANKWFFIWQNRRRRECVIFCLITSYSKQDHTADVSKAFIRQDWCWHPIGIAKRSARWRFRRPAVGPARLYRCIFLSTMLTILVFVLHSIDTKYHNPSLNHNVCSRKFINGRILLERRRP